MEPGAYEAWYDTPRGRWMEGVEYRLLKSQLRPDIGSSALDIGCGTGHFTRLLAGDAGGPVIGIDPNADWVSYASALNLAIWRLNNGAP